MSILFKRIVPWFRQMTDREPMEVDVPAEFRRSRLGSRGILFARLDQPSVPRGRRMSKKALEAFPMITAAFYGPDDLHASKLVLAHIPSSVSEPGDLERWVAPDVLGEAKVLEEGRAFLAKHPSLALLATAGSVGCPHEEGEDFAVGADCPLCPFWKGKQRG